MNVPFKFHLRERGAPIELPASNALGARANSSMERHEEAQFEADLIELEPFLRSFARNLARDKTLADDLTQDTFLRAWRARTSYKRGTNLKAWLCIILRNHYYSYLRRAWRQTRWDEARAERLSDGVSPQLGAVELGDMLYMLKLMPAHLREALTLIGVGGFSYKEAANICNCKEGTLKSRVVRARRLLTALLEGDKTLPSMPPRNCTLREEIPAELARLAYGAGSVRVRPRARGPHD